MYRAHGFRPGHARDLQAAGASLYQQLSAGEWQSPALLKYLDLQQLELDVVVEPHLEESIGDEKDGLGGSARN